MRPDDEKPHPQKIARQKTARSRQVAVWALIGVAVYNLTVAGDVPGAEKFLYAALLAVIGGVATWADLKDLK